jgi:catechol 2,3-dioxygenase
MSSIDPSLRIRAVQLAVSDLARSTDFYARVLGLPLLEQDGRRARLGADGDAALELVGLERPRAASPRSTGLFHVAWLHPSRAGLAETVRRVAASGWPFQGASDHGVSEALYLGDPDDLGIEIYVDRPRELWARPVGGSGVVMVTEPLDLEDLLAQSPGEPAPAAEPGTGIGHVHLKVADVARALSFYSGLGFEEQARLPSAAFVSAGGYHHHLGMNTWQSAGGEPAAADAPGLRRIDFELSGEDQLAALAAGAGGDHGQQVADGRLELRGPDGELLTFAAPQAA